MTIYLEIRQEWSVGQGTVRFRIRAEFNMAPFERRLLRRQLHFLWFVMGAVFLLACTKLAKRSGFCSMHHRICSIEPP